MAVVVRRGRLRTGVVVVDGDVYRVRRGKGGWYTVCARTPYDDGRVLFDDPQDHATLQRSDGTVEIQFHLEETVFGWQARAHQLASMEWGQITIDQEGRTVARGHVTVSGIHLETVAPELLPIVREPAFALTLHSEFLARDRRMLSAAAAVGGG